MRLGQFSIRDTVWLVLVAALLAFGLIDWMRSRQMTGAVTVGKISWTNSQTQISYASFPQGMVENGRFLVVYSIDETSVLKGIVQVTKVVTPQLVECRQLFANENNPILAGDRVRLIPERD